MFIDHVLFINRYQGRSKAYYIDAPIHHRYTPCTGKYDPSSSFKKKSQFISPNLPNTISGFKMFKVCVFSIHFCQNNFAPLKIVCKVKTHPSPTRFKKQKTRVTSPMKVSNAIFCANRT